MGYVKRQLQGQILEIFQGAEVEGLILAGIVGAGKTTLINEVLKELKDEYETFSFTGDEIYFRDNVARDTKWILEQVRADTPNKALVFIDEVQKSESIFDAVKYAYDGGISFIVSGSNPAYLNTIARKRLQRRGDFLTLPPLTLPEILAHEKLVPEGAIEVFHAILAEKKVTLPKSVKFSITPEIKEIRDNYLIYGGLPGAYETKSATKKMRTIKQVVERGFEAISRDTEDVTDLVRVELAHIHSRELTYKGMQKRVRVVKRDTINYIINGLVGHGYLHKKTPLIFERDRRSYLNIFAYADPGIVSYLTGKMEVTDSKGQRVEGIVHSQLNQIRQLLPTKTQLDYFKPYRITGTEKRLNFMDGEIDFVIAQGNSIIPIEVKSSTQITDSETALVRKFIAERKSPFGVILYAGVPQWRKEHKLLFWPYWLV